MIIHTRKKACSGKPFVKEMRLPSPDGELVFTPGNLPDDEQFEEFGRMMQCRTEFADDGSLNTLMFVPEEMKAEAAEHGVVVREDGYAVIESTTWKEENGKFYYDTKTEGEVFGEKVDPFAEIPVTTDGCLVYSYGTILLERA